MEGFDIRAPKGQRKNKRLGRGVGSGHGKTAGKGTKGQKARAGGGVRLGFEGGQMPLFRRIARRGFSNYPFKKIYQVVNVGDLNRFSDGDTVTPESLASKGLARRKSMGVKILGAGELARKLTVEGVHVSESARAKIVALGGVVKDLPVNPTDQPREGRARKPAGALRGRAAKVAKAAAAKAEAAKAAAAKAEAEDSQKPAKTNARDTAKGNSPGTAKGNSPGTAKD
jgi:large subunit ribosomal protein L15